MGFGTEEAHDLTSDFTGSLWLQSMRGREVCQGNEASIQVTGGRLRPGRCSEGRETGKIDFTGGIVCL